VQQLGFGSGAVRLAASFDRPNIRYCVRYADTLPHEVPLGPADAQPVVLCVVHSWPCWAHMALTTAFYEPCTKHPSLFADNSASALLLCRVLLQAFTSLSVQT
jgi:hypothetical protein